ncbi:MAG: helix-turn-helix domain-containing protein [Micromonosporaceae bacterium]
MSETSPTLRKRRVGRTLRAMREAAGVSREKVAEELDCSPWKIGRIETGHVGCRRGDLLTMLDMYGVTDEDKRADLVQQAREARTRRQSPDIDLPDNYQTLIDLEPHAQSIRWYEPTLIPGLLQTEDYARAVIRAGRFRDRTAEVEHRVKVRLERQQRIFDRDEPPEVWTIIDEAAIRRVVGGAKVMREQCHRLVRIWEQRLARVQVLPFDAGAPDGTPVMFQLLRFADRDDPDIVYVEVPVRGGLFLDGPEDIARVSLVFDHLIAQALSPERSMDLIREAGRHLA